MKYLKMLGLAAVAACALMAFVGAGTASATEITCEGVKCPAGTVIKAQSEGHAVLDAPIGKIECNGTVEGTVETAGSSSTTAKGPITNIGWFNCTNAHVTTLATGSLEIHTDPEGQPANGNGTLTSTGASVTVNYFGFHCIFGTNATDLGTVTGSSVTKGHATLDISATIPRTGGSSGAFCGSSAPWTGSYTVTSPKSLIIH